MSRMSYLSSIERYHEYQDVIQSLMMSIIITIEDSLAKGREISALAKQFPFLELEYYLDESGVQVGNNLCFQAKNSALLSQTGHQQDHSQRPYFVQMQASQQTCLTEPYFSIATKEVCLTAIKPLRSPQQGQYYIVIDARLTQLIEYIMGDTARANMTPYFKAGYGVIVACLFCLVLFLISCVFSDIYDLVKSIPDTFDPLQPFSIIIFITLALSVFDLGKTILEEEILMHKDIFRHSSTRRTVTRFISTVLIAISIEALLTMFKAALGQAEFIMPAITMMLAVVGLLIALAIYVYLGAKAEHLLLSTRSKQKAS